MTESSEALGRREILRRDLDQEIKRYSFYAKLNYSTAYAMRLLIIATSLAAGIGGVFLKKEFFALIAFIPAAAAILASSLKLQDRANWHFRKKEALEALRNRLLFELPDPLNCKDVAEVSRDLSALNRRMTGDWEALLGPDIPVATKPPDRGDPPKG